MDNTRYVKDLMSEIEVEYAPLVFAHDTDFVHTAFDMIDAFAEITTIYFGFFALVNSVIAIVFGAVSIFASGILFLVELFVSIFEGSTGEFPVTVFVLAETAKLAAILYGLLFIAEFILYLVWLFDSLISYVETDLGKTFLFVTLFVFGTTITVIAYLAYLYV